MSRKLKVLMNAEPFGFGPTAAISDFFPYLRQAFLHLAYVGSGHSLDLQKPLPYNAIFDISNMDEDFEAIVRQYELFVTALDFEKAARALACGVPTIIYDPLTWFWNKVPDVAQRCLYIAQGFHGVEERLKTIPNSVMVPPLVPLASGNIHRAMVFVNFGGLQNPMWPEKVALSYADCLIEAFKTAVPKGDPYIIVTNAKIANALKTTGVSIFSRTEVNALLPMVKYALKTPGLSNIYDAAAYDIPTLFVPPANDSQGQQLRLIQEHGTIDSWVDWPELTGENMDYRADQGTVLDQIRHNIDLLQGAEMMDKLVECLRTGISTLDNRVKSNVTALLDQYGRGGAEAVAKEIINYAQEMKREAA